MEPIFRVLLTNKQLMFCGTRDKRFGSLWSEEGLSRKIIFSPRRTSVLLLKRTYCSKQWIVAKVIKIDFALKLGWNIFLLNCKLETKWTRFILGSYYWWQSCRTWAENLVYRGLVNLLDTVVLFATFSKWVLKALHCIELVAELLQDLINPANLQMVRRQRMFSLCSRMRAAFKNKQRDTLHNEQKQVSVPFTTACQCLKLEVWEEWPISKLLIIW